MHATCQIYSDRNILLVTSFSNINGSIYLRYITYEPYWLSTTYQCRRIVGWCPQTIDAATDDGVCNTAAR